MWRNVVPTALALVVLGGGLSMAAEDEAPAAKVSTKDRASTKDPVDAAFVLPPGVQPTAKQRASLDKLRERYEPHLREAMDKVSSGEDERSKRAAAKDVTRIKHDIRTEIVKVLLESPAEDPQGRSGSQGSRSGERTGTDGGTNWGYNPGYGTGYYGRHYYPYAYWPAEWRSYYREAIHLKETSTGAPSSTPTGKSTKTHSPAPAPSQEHKKPVAGKH